MRHAHKIPNQEIPLPFKIERPVLALGSQTKNTVCFARGKTAYLSRIHPDLANLQNFLDFEQDTKYFLKKRPRIIASDLHPEYSSTKYAQKLSAIRYPLSAIQHHHAHIASCMADNNLKNQKVIGVAFDGTGLGTDNTLWGAEFLICDYKNFKRVAHLQYIPLLGGEKAIHEPWRLAAAWLYAIYKDRFLNLGLGWTKKIKARQWQVLEKMYLTGVNSPLASSMGRLFDAAASLVLAKPKANFEAELAMELEKLIIADSVERIAYSKGQRAKGKGQRVYSFEIYEENRTYIISPVDIFKQIIRDLKAREPKEKMAYKFHCATAEIIRKMCLILRRETKINKVVLSGGVFQNKVLLKIAVDLLYKEGFQVSRHQRLASNDSGISLGQAMIAGFR